MPSLKSPKSRTRSKSPARSARSRSRSRGRSKSPSRKARTESKSPSRKQRTESKSPARKSPSRKAKNVSEVKEVAVVSEKEEKSEASQVTVTKTTTTQERTAAVFRSSASTPTRHSARIASMNSQRDYTDSKQEVQQSSSREKKSTKKRFEAGGPIVTFLMTLFLPMLVLAVNFACNKTSCSLKSFLEPLTLFPRSLSAYFDQQSLLMVAGFHAFITVLAALPAGKTVEGVPLKGGKRLKYRLNGMFVMAVCTVTFAFMWYFNCGVTLIYKKFTQLMATSIVHSFVLSLALYFRASRAPKSSLAEAGNTGCITHDFFMGRELNPRFGEIDLKFVLTYVGLMSYFVLNLAFLAQSYDTNKTIDYTLLLAVIFQNMYLASGVFLEEAIVSSPEVVKYGLGFGYVVTVEAFIPFLYGLTTRYLLEHPKEWNPYWLSAFTFFHLTGFVIYMGSNVQKYRFRKNPNDPAFANMETIPTSSGKKLLVSGWWGLVRHPNYLGDLIMAFTWSALCGCDAWMVYLYPLFLLMLLVDRSRSDGKWCKEKHGAAWDRYCQRVKYQLFPYVF